MCRLILTDRNVSVTLFVGEVVTLIADDELWEADTIGLVSSSDSFSSFMDDLHLVVLSDVLFPGDSSTSDDPSLNLMGCFGTRDDILRWLDPLESVGLISSDVIGSSST